MFLVFDTETTALVANSAQPLHKQPQIIEFFGLFLNDDFEEAGTIHQLFHPGKPLPAEVVKITSITDDMLKGAPSFAIGHEPVIAAIERSHTVVAHNLSYDMSVVNFEMERLKKKVVWPHNRVCTVEATEHMKGFRLNLGALHSELFGESFTGAHRAENDVRALARCFVELARRGEI
jgi:DNA polymerase III epsilon subunit-like protein